MAKSEGVSYRDFKCSCFSRAVKALLEEAVAHRLNVVQKEKRIIEKTVNATEKFPAEFKNKVLSVYQDSIGNLNNLLSMIRDIPICKRE